MSRWSWVLLVFLLAACAQLPQRSVIGPEQINSWLAEREYGNALAALQREVQLRPDNASLRDRLYAAWQQASRYAAEQIAKAEELAQQSRWNEALQQLDEALGRWPQSAVLRVARDALENRRQQRIEELQLELLLHEGRSLLESARAHRELERANPGYLYLDWDLRKYQAKRRAVAKELLQVGRQVQEEGDLRLAQHCLVMAQRLDDSPEVRAALAQLPPIEQVEESEVFEPRRHRRDARYVSRRVQQKRQLSRLLAEYAQVWDQGDLVAARRLMLRMEEINPEHPRVKELKSEQERVIQQTVERGVARGDDLYSQERIEEAARVWEEMLRLDPFNKELRNKLDRARTALKTLQELKQHPR